MARQHVLHQRHRPGFERLGHQGVVGVREHTLALRPRVGPRHAMPVGQQAHQLGHRDGRMRVVQMDRHFVGQVVEPPVLFEVAVDDVVHRRGDEEVFLPQAQLAPGRRAVVRVQHPRDVLERVLHLGRARVVAAVECVQVDVRRRGRLPQPQRADLARAVAGHDHVVGLRDDLSGGPPQHFVADLLDRAAEVHRHADARTRKLPRRAVGQPRVGVLDLPAVHDVLREHAVLVADAVAERRQPERGHRVEKACRQPAEAAVAERSVGFVLGNVFQLAGVRAHRFARVAVQVERRQRVAQAAPHQELHRQVVHAAHLGFALERLRARPSARRAAGAPSATRPASGRRGVASCGATPTTVNRCSSTPTGVERFAGNVLCITVTSLPPELPPEHGFHPLLRGRAHSTMARASRALPERSLHHHNGLRRSCGGDMESKHWHRTSSCPSERWRSCSPAVAAAA